MNKNHRLKYKTTYYKYTKIRNTEFTFATVPSTKSHWSLVPACVTGQARGNRYPVYYQTMEILSKDTYDRVRIYV